MATKRKSEGQTAFDAEVRAVEEGHRAFFVHVNGKPAIKVVSDTTPGRHYIVTAHADARGVAIFECRSSDPNFLHASSGKAIPCKHAALAGRRLEREGIVTWHDALFWIKPDFLQLLAIPTTVSDTELDEIERDLQCQ